MLTFLLVYLLGALVDVAILWAYAKADGIKTYDQFVERHSQAALAVFVFLSWITILTFLVWATFEFLEERRLSK